LEKPSTTSNNNSSSSSSPFHHSHQENQLNIDSKESPSEYEHDNFNVVKKGYADNHDSNDNAYKHSSNSNDFTRNGVNLIHASTAHTADAAPPPAPSSMMLNIKDIDNKYSPQPSIDYGPVPFDVPGKDMRLIQ